jgi:hypothetical protein
MPKVIRVGLLAVMALGAPLALPAPAQEKLTIVKINVPQLDVFADDKGTTKTATLESATVALPLDVLAKAPTGRLKVRLPDGREGWVDGMRVTAQPSGLSKSSGGPAVPCDPGRGVVAGATRSSGKGCK